MLIFLHVHKMCRYIGGGVVRKFPMVSKLVHVHRRAEGVVKITFVGDPRILKNIAIIVCVDVRA